MKNTLNQFQKAVEKYEQKIRKGMLIDGVVDPKEYFNTNPKIAWMLKEAYTDEEDGGHIRDYYGQPDAYRNFFRYHHQTWHPVIYASYAILNGFQRWNDLPYIRDQPTMCDIIRKIAIINASKAPSITGANTKSSNLANSFCEWWPIVKEQLDVLKPQVLIFGGTFKLYKNPLGLGKEPRHGRYKLVDIWRKDGKIFIDAYHPAYAISRKRYFDSIIDSVREWSESART